MDAEYQALLQNCTWILIRLPPSHKTVGCMWVFEIKYEANGKIERYKAKFVAKGSYQIKMVDYHETFSPVVKISNPHLIFAIVAILNLAIHQVDVKTAIRNSDLIEIIFMDQPVGYVVEGSEHLICLLPKVFYSLKQPLRAWHKR